MKDPIKTIGQLITDQEQRDAIHIAILPCRAANYLLPGTPVGLVYGTKNQVRWVDPKNGGRSIGIVDPFLTEGVKKWQWCWVFLYPNTVQGMRHHWYHPGVDDPTPQPTSEAEKWLRGFAQKWNFDYDEMLYGAQQKEGWVVAHGMDIHSAQELAPGDEELFWKYVQELTGKEFDKEHRDNFTWSCSC